MKSPPIHPMPDNFANTKHIAKKHVPAALPRTGAMFVALCASRAVLKALGNENNGGL